MNDLIRKTIRYRRRMLSKALKNHWDQQIIKQLIDHPHLKNRKKVGAYLHSDGEVDLAEWFAWAWKHNQPTYVPIMSEEKLQFSPYDASTSMASNAWDILEPTHPTYIDLCNLEVMLIPLVAFDAYGNRLGRGKGYYDKTLATLKPHATHSPLYLIGIGYAFQQVETLIPHAWDIPLHAVVTEEKIITFDT